ncbi:DUF4153 domain-containing protein [Reichenbachiella versicolor]|uniref:DUF4153 domain-containing protein n=1 Tax=Reichenbachiella versicolor TaxID=1821036 RepID=UPI000D6DFEBD|nr:DUF4153 domain-containing protein [Reichenbachiella versicolor]
MKLPSISYLTKASLASFKRFPLSIICGFIGSLLSIYMVEYEDSIDNYFPFINSLLVAALGIPLFFCVNIFQEKYLNNRLYELLTYGAAISFLVLIYFSFPDREVTHNTSLPYIRYGIFNLIVHLIVSFIPYIRTKQLNGFWNYNKSLFLRILTSILYSLALYLGLVLALFALDTLFGMDIDEEQYLDTFFLVVGLFNTWFFLSGIPTDFDALEQDYSYPKGLKIFTQYILLPLLILYIIILYAYGVKIIGLWNWPKGIVSYLISVVSVIGILAFLLIHPFGFQNGNGWIKKFSKVYYYLLFPLVILLFIAIGMRISDYGVTINRYVIVLLGVWLTLVSIYFSINKTNIKFIPVSLAIILVLVSFGPWGMFSYSERSQVSRLMTILKENDLLENDKSKFEPTWQFRGDSYLEVGSNRLKASLSDSLSNEVYSILNYLDDHHGFVSIRSIYNQNLDSLISISADSHRYINEAKIYMESLGLNAVYLYNNDYNYFSFWVNDEDKFLEISGYDYLINLGQLYLGNGKQTQSINVNNVEHTISFDCEGCISMKIESLNDSASLPLDSLANELSSKYGNDYNSAIDPSHMILEGRTKSFEYRINFDHLYLERKSGVLKVNSFNGYLLIKELSGIEDNP